MPYPEMMIAPMREELRRIGFQELRTSAEVDETLASEQRSTLLVVNSMCGCAAGAARPAVWLSLRNEQRPEVLVTVFAGQDLEATERAREYIVGYPPSSPAIALFREGELVWMLERHGIQGRSAEEISQDLKGAYDEHCASTQEEVPQS